MKLKISYLSPELLIPYVRNAKVHPEEQITQIAGSIKEFGFVNPVIIDGDKTIIAGHGRLLAAIKLGLKEVPAIYADHLTPAQIKAFRLADNRIAQNGSWDIDMLKIELKELDDLQCDLSDLGWSKGELDAMFFEPDFKPGSEDDQGQLDKKKSVQCPECGHEFSPS